MFSNAANVLWLEFRRYIPFLLRCDRFAEQGPMQFGKQLFSEQHFQLDCGEDFAGETDPQWHHIDQGLSKSEQRLDSFRSFGTTRQWFGGLAVLIYDNVVNSPCETGRFRKLQETLRNFGVVLPAGRGRVASTDAGRQRWRQACFGIKSNTLYKACSARALQGDTLHFGRI